MFHVTKQVIKDMCQPQHLENIIQVEGAGAGGMWKQLKKMKN
jgi:hypothetical protein